MKNLTLRKHIVRISVLGILFFLINTPQKVKAQPQDTIRFELTSIPKNTPDSSVIYMVSSLNNWQTLDENFKLERSSKGQYFIDIPRPEKAFEYKFTRGDWTNVEGNIVGYIRPNRFYEPYFKSPIQIEILSWQDQVKQLGQQAEILITSIPTKTPYDASLFLASEFDNWNPHNPEYKFQKDKDGNYYLKLPKGMEQFDYKITRGSWESVEGRENGRAINNRKFSTHENGNRIEIKVSSWEDLSGNTMTTYMFLLLLSAFQGFMLIISIFSIQNNNRSANKYLGFLIFAISLALIGRVTMFYRDIFQAFPKLYLLPELVLFLYGPLFYTYIFKLSVKDEEHRNRKGIQFIPFCIQLIVYIPFWSMSNEDFILKVMNQELDLLLRSVGGIGLLFNTYYWWQSKKIWSSQAEKSYHYLSEEHKLNYLNGIINMYFLCLVIWAILYLSAGVAYIFSYEAHHVEEFLIDTLWLTIAFVSFVMGYYAMNQAEILQIPDVQIQRNDALPNWGHVYKKEEIIKEEVGLSEMELQLKELLKIQMESKGLYKNPHLNLTDLARVMDCSTNDLSRVINEGFQKNFHDFINQYRIEAFIGEVLNDIKQEYTYLGHAYNVGFNSKTAFNRAFKKLLGITPSQYFQEKE